MKIAAFASGSGTNIEALVNNGIEIELIICNKADAYIVTRAQKLDIKCVVIPTKGIDQRVYETEMLEVLTEHNIQLILLAGYMKIIGGTLLKSYEGRIINIHPSLLPSFKGAHAIDDAFNYGVKYSGVTIHYIDSKIDEGTIIDQQVVKIATEDTIESFELKIHQAEYDLFHKVVKKVLKEIDEKSIN